MGQGSGVPGGERGRARQQDRRVLGDLAGNAVGAHDGRRSVGEWTASSIGGLDVGARQENRGQVSAAPPGGPGGEGCGRLSGVGTSMFGALNGGVVD